MVVDYMLEDSPIFRLELDKHGEIILPKEIGPGLETSVCEGIHTFLNIYMDFKYRFAGLWDLGDWVSLLLFTKVFILSLGFIWDTLKMVNGKLHYSTLCISTQMFSSEVQF